MTIDPLRRRAIVNGVLAAAVTLIVGYGIVASVEGGEIEEALPTVTPSSSPSPTPPACLPSWEVVQSADPGDVPNELLGVTVLSSAEAWAVGASGDPTAPTSVLIERWDGNAWTVEQAPNPGTELNELRAVDASEPNDVWAVGRTASGFGDRPLALRFDGTAWSEVELPDEIDGVLTGVAAIAPDDVWVVGYTGDPAASLEYALILHWDGLLWAAVDPGRAVGTSTSRSALLDVEASAPDDVWAVGYLRGLPLIVHYDGERWTRSPTAVDGAANAIEPVSPSDGWIAGSPIQRYDGSAWAAAANVRDEGELFGIVALSETDVWAAGLRPTEDGTTKALMVRWDGGQWRPVDGPGVAGSDALAAIDGLPDGTLLAVGYQDVETGRRTVAVEGSSCPPAA